MRWLWIAVSLIALDFRCHSALGETASAAVDANILPNYLTSIGKEYGCKWVRGEAGNFVCRIERVYGQVEFHRESLASKCSVEMIAIIVERVTGNASVALGEQLAQRLIHDTVPTLGPNVNKIHEYIENIRAGGDGINFDVSNTAISMQRLQPADVEDLFLDLTVSGKQVCGVR